MNVRSDLRDVRTKDIILAVFMAVLALLVTLPATLLAAGMAYHSRDAAQLAFPFAAVTLLNGYVLGYPAIVLLRRWRHRIRHGKTGYDWAWGHYWRLQFQMLVPLLAGGLLLFAITFVQWALSRFAQ